jgi:hypothetical protein
MLAQLGVEHLGEGWVADIVSPSLRLRNFRIIPGAARGDKGTLLAAMLLVIV